MSPEEVWNYLFGWVVDRDARLFHSSIGTSSIKPYETQTYILLKLLQEKAEAEGIAEKCGLLCLHDPTDNLFTFAKA